MLWAPLQALDEVSPYVKSAADTVSPYVKTAVETVRDVAGPAFRQAQPQLQVQDRSNLAGVHHPHIVVWNARANAISCDVSFATRSR